MLKFYHWRKPYQSLIGSSSEEQYTLPLLYNLIASWGKNDAEFRRLYSTVSYRDELLECWFRWDSAKETPLVELLMRFAGRDISDIRERIYGLLGLTCKMDRDALTPDYSRGKRRQYCFKQSLFISFRSMKTQCKFSITRVHLIASSQRSLPTYLEEKSTSTQSSQTLSIPHSLRHARP